MELAIERNADHVDVRASGELDIASSAELYRTFETLRGEGARAIRLDVSGVGFVDSAGLGALLRWKDETRERGESFSVQGARGLVKRVLRQTEAEEMLAS